MTFELRQAEDRIEGRRVARIGVASAVVFFLSLVTAGVLLGVFGRPSAAHDEAAEPPGTVERSLVLATKKGVDERARDRASLSEWGWVDRDAGIARIPIERAMDLVVAGDGGAP